MIIEKYLGVIIPYIAGALEAIGVFIIAFAGAKGIILLVKNKFNFGDEGVGIELAKAMSLSLSFKLAAEILKTVTVHTMEEFKVLAAIAVLRVSLHFVLHWEIKESHKDKEESLQMNKKVKA